MKFPTACRILAVASIGLVGVGCSTTTSAVEDTEPANALTGWYIGHGDDWTAIVDAHDRLVERPSVNNTVEQATLLGDGYSALQASLEEAGVGDEWLEEWITSCSTGYKATASFLADDPTNADPDNISAAASYIDRCKTGLRGRAGSELREAGLPRPTDAAVDPPPAKVPVVTQPRRPAIEYRWSGTASGVNLTLTNAQGNTEQASGRANNQDFSIGRVDPGEFLYISVQNTSESGTVTCEILEDDVVISTATSTGSFVIASCDASAGE